MTYKITLQGAKSLITAPTLCQAIALARTIEEEKENYGSI
jgi:hypothetical protein